jgi:hypothetical protein
VTEDGKSRAVRGFLVVEVGSCFTQAAIASGCICPSWVRSVY